MTTIESYVELITLLGPPDPRRVVLYRHYDRDGALLYLGCGERRAMRTRHLDYARTARWWRFVARVEIGIEVERRGGLAARRRAVAAERPVFNHVGLYGADEQEAWEAHYLREHADVRGPAWLEPAARRRMRRPQVTRRMDDMLRDLGVLQDFGQSP